MEFFSLFYFCEHCVSLFVEDDWRRKSAIERARARPRERLRGVEKKKATRIEKKNEKFTFGGGDDNGESLDDCGLATATIVRDLIAAKP